MRKLLFALFAIGSLVGCNSGPTPTTSSTPAKAATTLPPSPADAFRATGEDYVISKKAGGWWLDRPSTQPSAEQVRRMIEVGQAVGELLRDQQASYARVKEMSYFKHIYFGYELNGQLVTTSSDAVVSHPKSVGIVFYSKQEAGQHPASLWYNAQKHAVMVAAFDWDPNFIGAAVIHELGHALADMQGKPGSAASDTSDKWIEEEVSMHELEMRLLDAKSNGRYFRVAEEILGRVGGLDDVVDILTKVSADDFRLLDAAITDSVSKEEAGSFIVQHALTLAFRQTNADTTEMVRFYRAMTSK